MQWACHISQPWGYDLLWTEGLVDTSAEPSQDETYCSIERIHITQKIQQLHLKDLSAQSRSKSQICKKKEARYVM